MTSPLYAPGRRRFPARQTATIKLTHHLKRRGLVQFRSEPLWLIPRGFGSNAASSVKNTASKAVGGLAVVRIVSPQKGADRRHDDERAGHHGNRCIGRYQAALTGKRCHTGDPEPG